MCNYDLNKSQINIIEGFTVHLFNLPLIYQQLSQFRDKDKSFPNQLN